MTDIPPVWELRRSDPRYYRALRQARINRGQCASCSKPAVPGKRLCASCATRKQREQRKPHHLQRHREYMKEVQEYRKSQGLCYICGRMLSHLDWRHVICHDCRKHKNELARVSHRKQNDRRRAAGICVRCGKVKVEAGRRNCAECRAKNAANAREGKRRRKAQRQRRDVTLAS